MTNIIILAVLGGIGISISLSIIGNFIVWKKLSYISDAISHSSILGIVVGVLFSSSPDIFIIIICFIFSILIVILQDRFNFTQDALLVSITQFSLSLGAIIFALLNKTYILPTFLFGDLLGLTLQTVIIIFIFALLIIVYVWANWHKLILVTINSHIAKAEGVANNLQNILFIILLSSTIAYSVKFVGVLLVPSLVILPVLISSFWAKTPFQSIIFSFIINVAAIILGIILSTLIDISLGPLITISLIGLLVINIIIYACKNS